MEFLDSPAPSEAGVPRGWIGIPQPKFIMSKSVQNADL